MDYRKYLILGHSRSGTGYAASLFRENGVDIDHEEMGEDGTSSWMMAVESEKYPWSKDKRQDYKFETVIHVVRNPIDVITSSAYTENPVSEEFRSKFVAIAGNELERVIESYFGWTNLIQSQKPNLTVKVENLKDAMGFKLDTQFRNERKHGSMTEEELNSKVDEFAWGKYLWLKDFYNNL